MLKRSALGLPILFILVIFDARAQGVCPLNGTASSKLLCVLPQVYGATGLGTGNGPKDVIFANHSAAFEGDFISNSGLGPINEAVGIQASQLPIASPSSGITFTYDPSLKTFTPSTQETLGPILGERATTIGRNRLYFGFSFQYFDFNTVDGQKLSGLVSVLQHTPFPADPSDPACPNQTGMFAKYAGDPCFTRDFFQSTTNIDLTVHQYTIYLTYGLTSKLDFSAAIPFLNVNETVTNSTTIFPNAVAPITADTPGGVFHQFNPPAVPSCTTGLNPPCLRGSFSNSGSSAGIGDVILRGKYEVYKGERAGFALGMDVRLPSGDAGNFLGSGAAGVKPFGVFSYAARVSPHAEIGYEWNGKSILAGDFVGPTATNAKRSLPNRFVYGVGADISIVKRLTGAFDILGQRLFGAPQLFPTTYTDQGKCSDPNCTTVTPGTTHTDLGVNTSADYNITNASLGLKFRLAGRFVVTGNVLLKLDDGGLRAKAVPLVGASYSF